MRTALLRRKGPPLEPGHRFQGRDGLTWVVQYLVRTGNDQAHAKLIGLQDHTASKLISVDALLDRHLFRSIGHADPQPVD